MLVNFSEMNASSKVWIYTSDRSFKDEEIVEINKLVEAFINTWKRHGDDLKASFEIKYNQFLVLAVDESYNNISGCSIDASVNLIKQLEQQFNVDLTNKLNLPFRNVADINVVSYADFQSYAKQGKISPDTIVFNNMVGTVGDYKTKWEVEASSSWHKRFFN